MNEVRGGVGLFFFFFWGGGTLRGGGRPAGRPKEGAVGGGGGGQRRVWGGTGGEARLVSREGGVYAYPALHYKKGRRFLYTHIFFTRAGIFPGGEETPDLGGQLSFEGKWNGRKKNWGGKQKTHRRYYRIIEADG